MSFNTPLIHMGLPSLEYDNIDFSLNLHTLLVKNPTSTFFVSLDTHIFAKYGLYNKDVLVVDRSLNNPAKPRVFEYEGKFTLEVSTNLKSNMVTPKFFFGTVIGVARKI